MVATVRGVSDWLRAKRIWWLAVPLMAGTVQIARAQETHETPQQQKSVKVQELAALASAQPVDATIGSGDLLHIDVFDVPELSRDVRVSDTGDISYPLIPGKIVAAGLTPFQLESKVEQLLLENGLVSHPQVSVFVKEQNSQPVSVVGAVGHPMVYQVMRPTTLLEVLTAAGGVTDDAGNIVIVTRPETRGRHEGGTGQRDHETRTEGAKNHDSAAKPAGVREIRFTTYKFTAAIPSRCPAPASYTCWESAWRSRGSTFCRTAGSR